MYFEKVRTGVVEIAEVTSIETAKRIESSAMMDAIRCRGLSDETDVEANREEFRQYNEEIQEFISKRIEFLDEEWSR